LNRQIVVLGALRAGCLPAAVLRHDVADARFAARRPRKAVRIAGGQA